jgi:hypothetical protein
MTAITRNFPSWIAATVLSLMCCAHADADGINNPGCPLSGCTMVFPAGGGLTLAEPSVSLSASVKMFYGDATNFPEVTSELIFQNNVGGRNVLDLYNLNSTGYSAMVFLGDQNASCGNAGQWAAGAIGVGNSGSGTPWAESLYIEASCYTGSPHTNPPMPFKIVQTGYLNSTYGSYVRQEFDNAGHIIFHNLNGFNDIYYDSLNGWLGWRRTPQAQVDINLSGGTSSDRAVFSDGNGDHSAYFSAGYAVNFLTAASNQLQVAKTSVSRFGLSVDGTSNVSSDRRASVVDLDNSNHVPLAINLSGTDIVGFGGASTGNLFTSANAGILGVGTVLEARLGDNSGFAFLQGKLKTDTAYIAGTTAAAGYLTFYDSTGTAYKVNACTGC